MGWQNWSLGDSGKFSDARESPSLSSG